jgi:hypothetical protein
MNAEEFEKWVQEETDFSVLDVADINVSFNRIVIDVESIMGIAEAYHQSRVNGISDEVILLGAIQQDSMNEQVAWGDGAKWLKEQLLKQ